MKSGEIIGLGLLGILAFGFINKAKGLGTINFFPNRIENFVFDGPNPVISFSILVQNTSGQDYTLRSFAGNLMANNILVGTVYSFETFKIPANGQVLWILQSTLQSIGIVNDLINAFDTGNFFQKLSLEGRANIDDYNLPVNISYDLGHSETAIK